MSEKLWFSDFFMGYRNKTFAQNRLKNAQKNEISKLQSKSLKNPSFLNKFRKKMYSQEIADRKKNFVIKPLFCSIYNTKKSIKGVP